MRASAPVSGHCSGVLCANSSYIFYADISLFLYVIIYDGLCFCRTQNRTENAVFMPQTFDMINDCRLDVSPVTILILIASHRKSECQARGS